MEVFALLPQADLCAQPCAIPGMGTHMHTQPKEIAPDMWRKEPRSTLLRVGQMLYKVMQFAWIGLLSFPLCKRMSSPHQVKVGAVSSCQHCWPFPARDGPQPYPKSCLSLPQGTSSAFVRSHSCEGSDFSAQWPPNLLALVLCLRSVHVQGRVPPCQTQTGVCPPPEMRCSRKNT